jgi:hypothetical protein
LIDLVSSVPGLTIRERMMKLAGKAAQAGEQHESLEQVKQRFAQWREGRKHGEHISNALWAAAVCMVEEYGLQRIAQELRLNHKRLKQRVDCVVAAGQTIKPETQFVEMFVPSGLSAASTCECMVEMENGRGGKMRITLRGFDALVNVTSAFLNAP